MHHADPGRRYPLCREALTPNDRARIIDGVQKGRHMLPAQVASEWGVPFTLAQQLIRSATPRTEARSLLDHQPSRASDAGASSGASTTTNRKEQQQ